MRPLTPMVLSLALFIFLGVSIGTAAISAIILLAIPLGHRLMAMDSKKRRALAIGMVLVALPSAVVAFQLVESFQQPYTVIPVQKLILAVEDRSYFDLEGHEHPFIILHESVVTSYRLMGNPGRLVLPGFSLSMLRGAQAAARTWDGGGADNNWNTCANWDADTCPVANDTVTFNATSVKNATVNIATPVLTSITVGGGGSIYSGTITVSISQSNSWGDVILEPSTTGTISSASFTLIMGSLTVNASNIATGTGAVTITGNVNVAAAAAYITSNGPWTVSGSWTNASTSASWSFGTQIIFNSAINVTMTFCGNSCGGSNKEFAGGVKFDTTAVGGVTYTMATRGLNVGTGAGTIIAQNSASLSTGVVTLDTSSLTIFNADQITVGVRGVLVARNSTVTVGTVLVNNAGGYITSTSGGAWTVKSIWNNGSTSSSWSFQAPVTFADTTSDTFTPGNVGTEFGGNVIFDSGVAAGVTYTLGSRPLVIGGTLTLQQTAASPTGNTVIDTSASNFALTAGGLSMLARGQLVTRASLVTINGNVSITGTTAYWTNNGNTVTVTGSWTNNSTSASWSWGDTVVFKSATSQTMVYGGSNLPVDEFTNTCKFDSTAAAGVTYTLGTRGLKCSTVAGAVQVTNSTSGATGNTILDVSAGNLPITTVQFTIMAMGALVARDDTISVSTVNVNSATGYITTTSLGSWTITSTYSNQSTSGSWSWAAPVTFAINNDATLTFGNLSGNEFNNVTLNPNTVSGPTYTMATNGLKIGGTLTITNAGTGLTKLDTGAAGLSVQVTTITFTSKGGLTAHASNITVLGSWDSSPTTNLNMGTSTLRLAGTSGNVKLGASNSFYNITVISGSTYTAQDATACTHALIINGALTTGFPITGNSITVATTATLTITGIIVNKGFTETSNDSTDVVTISSFSRYDTNNEITFSFTSLRVSATLTWTFYGLRGLATITVVKGSTTLTTVTSDASGTATWTMLGGDPNMSVQVSGFGGPAPSGGGTTAPSGGGSFVASSSASLSPAGVTCNVVNVSLAGSPTGQVRWQWGDGTADTVTLETSARHVYAQPGTYTVQAYLNGIDGFQYTYKQVVTVTSGSICIQSDAQFLFSALLAFLGLVVIVAGLMFRRFRSLAWLGLVMAVAGTGLFMLSTTFVGFPSLPGG